MSEIHWKGGATEPTILRLTATSFDHRQFNEQLRRRRRRWRGNLHPGNLWESLEILSETLVHNLGKNPREIRLLCATQTPLDTPPETTVIFSPLSRPQRHGWLDFIVPCEECDKPILCVCVNGWLNSFVNVDWGSNSYPTLSQSHALDASLGLSFHSEGLRAQISSFSPFL